LRPPSVLAIGEYAERDIKQLPVERSALLLFREGMIKEAGLISGGVLDEQSRAKPRHKLFLPTAMLVGAERVRVHLLDLSASGAQVHFTNPPRLGTLVQIECAGALRMARVARCDGERFGIQFLTPLKNIEIEQATSQR
jgi:hypothetical protein